MHAHPDGVADSPRSVAPAVCIDTVHDLEIGQCATRLRGDLRIGNEFPLWDSIADVSAGDCRGHKVIVLTPTSGLQRQLCCIRAGGVQPYASDSRTALQQRRSSLRRTSVISLPLADRYAAVPDGGYPGNARMLRPSDICWK